MVSNSVKNREVTAALLLSPQRGGDLAQLRFSSGTVASTNLTSGQERKITDTLP